MGERRDWKLVVDAKGQRFQWVDAENTPAELQTSRVNAFFVIEGHLYRLNRKTGSLRLVSKNVDMNLT